jgi:hypothetical protein
MVRWFQSHPGVIALALTMVGFACMTWHGFYYVIAKRWFPPAPVIDIDSAFRWYLIAQALFLCALLIVLVPRLRPLK